MMNKLQKRVWIDLVGTTACVVLAGAGVALAVHFNAAGIVPVMSFVIGSLIVGLASGLRSIAAQSKFDEREKKLQYGLLSYQAAPLCFAAFTIFFLSGARSYIPAYTLPVLFLIGIFVSRLVQSAVILIQFAREQADEQ